MAKRICLPVKRVGQDEWAEISAVAPQWTHEICGEDVRPKDLGFSFAGQHRVRLYKFKKNVHWKIPTGVVTLDISAVPVANPPPRRQGGR